MDFPVLFVKTILLRPYVFLFLAIFLASASRLLEWRRTGLFFGLTWLTAFACEFSSTRTGIPFGWYFYTGSTRGQELYLSNVPFMDSLSFTFLLYASYCLALAFLLPVPWAVPPGSLLRREARPGWQVSFDGGTWLSWPVIGLSALFFALLDVVIDPVALRGDRWFLGQIYGYPEPGLYFGVPLANFAGWGVVGLLALGAYRVAEGRLCRDTPQPRKLAAADLLAGCGLYYGVLLFNLGVTFWIGEFLLGMTGVMIFLPITALLLLKLGGALRLA